MAGAEDGFDFDAVEIKDLSVLKQDFFVVRFHHRQFVAAEHHLAAHFSGQVTVFDIAQIDLGIFEKQLWVIRICLIVFGSISSQPIFSRSRA